MSIFAYIAAGDDDALTIIDVTDPANPTFKGSIQGAGAPNFLNGAFGVRVVGDYAYVAAGTDNALSIFDVTDPANPTFKGSIQGSGAPNFLDTASRVRVVGDYAYVAAGTDNALSIIDVTDPANPTFKGSIQGAGAPNFLDNPRDVFVVGSYAYIAANSDAALTIIDVTDPANPTFKGSIQGSGPPNFLFSPISVYVVGSYAYIATGDDALTIIDVTDPANPTFKGSIQGEGAPNFLDRAFGVHVVGNYAYVTATLDDALTIIDVTDPANPTFKGSIQGGGPPNFLNSPGDVFVVGSYAYIAVNLNDALTIIDISDPANPTFKGSIQGAGAPNFLDRAFGVTITSTLPLYKVEVDWDNDGVFEEGIETITADVRSLAWSRGADSELEFAQAGTLELVVNNGTGKYSPENTGSDLFPNVLPGRSIRVTALWKGVNYDLFKGKIEKYIPHPDAGRKDCYILCVDGFDQLERRIIEAPQHGAVTNSKIGATTQVSGVNITFTDANPDTIARASGSFVDDGFVAGMKVLVDGSSSNDGSYVIASVAVGTLTLDSNESLSAEGPSSGITLDGYGAVGRALDEAAWGTGSANRSLDTGVDVFDVWWAHKESALAALRKLAKAEASFMYVDGAGKFVYEDRHHRLGDGGGGATDHLTSQATFANTMTNIAYQFSARSVRNIINARGQKLTARSQAYVWETQDTPSLAALNGGTLVLWADLPKRVTGLVVPVANTDWKANTASDGSGDDETANVSIAGVKYGQALKMTLTNNTSPAKKLFIIPGTSDPEHTLRIQAQEYEDNPIFSGAEDPTSKTDYGERVLDIDIPFKGNFNDILSYAEYLLARKKDPQPDFFQMAVVNGTDALTTQILLRKLSDRITVTEDDLGISSQDYFINKMQHRVDMGGLRHEVTWSLARAAEEVFWVLGKEGYSELGQNTVLTF